MESQHKRFEVFNGLINVAAHGIHYHFHRLKHVGKSNHIVSVSLGVSQGQENVPSKIKFYIFSAEQLTNWIFNNLTVYSNTFFLQKRNFVRHIENTYDTFILPVTHDMELYFVLDNRYLSTITKQITLNILEEWDENVLHSDIVTTVPPQDESLKSQIEKMISVSKESLKILSPYADLSLVNRLLEKQNQGVKIQIILRKDSEVKGLSKDGLNQIRKNFAQSHKLHEDIHSRVIIRDDIEVLVSSADLTQKSLQGQLNLGIVISDPKIVEKTLDFFNKVWQESSG